MLQNPHYHSHAEQQAALGCAADLDPIKHPRRYAKQQAREKFRPTKRCPQPASEERTPELLEKAKALAHLGLMEAARELGVSRSVLDRLRADYGIEFAKPAGRNGTGSFVLEKAMQATLYAGLRNPARDMEIFQAVAGKTIAEVAVDFELSPSTVRAALKRIEDLAVFDLKLTGGG